MEDLPILPRSAWLLARASLTSRNGCVRKSSGILFPVGGPPAELEHDTVQTGREGQFNRTTGFLAPAKLEARLPPALEDWEKTMSDLPTLLREGTAHRAIESITSHGEAAAALPSRFLQRAAIIMGSLLHAFVFDMQNIGYDRKEISLPLQLVETWNTICCRLNRPAAIRTVADDILNNVQYQNERAMLSIEYFDLPEERLTAGIQVRMEETFAPALELMTDAQKYLHTDDHLALSNVLSGIALCIVDCGACFLSMSFRDLGKFDPVIWGKSYPEIGRPITANGLANSGVNSPLFHAVDAFIGMHQTSDEHELFRQQRIRRLAVLPALVRQFIEALAEPEHSVRSYVNNGRVSPCAAAAFDALVHSYIWLLEKHRIRAIGTVSIASASGRVTTAGGAQLETSSLYFSQRLNAQMMQSMASRLATRPRSMAATLVSRSPIGRRAIAVTLHFPCLLPIRAGDRVLVWPTADEDACTREECLFDGANGDPTPTTPTTPAILPVRPRHYSVSKVTQGNGRLAQQVTLSVADSEGMSVRFLRERPVGQSIRIRASPAPHFWPPAEPQTPLLLLGQGVGVGPFLGFLTERRASPTVGAIILILAARTIGDVPYLSDLEVLSQTLPLTVGLALSRDKCRILTQGAIAHQSRIMRAQDLLLHLQEDIQSLLRQGAHVYVCGSVDFGRSMRTALFTHWYLQEDRYHEECHGRATVSETRESFTLLDLAQHNQPSTIWIALGGVIYDLTPFRGTHPGGIKPLIEIAGMEADYRFRQVHSGDDAQGVIAQLSLYAIGTIEKRSMPSRLRSILRDIVDCQNVLTNNTWFASDRPVPFFVIAESLLVTSRSIARIQRGATTNNNSLTAPEDLQPIFQELKTECWTFLRDYMDISLDQKEKQVFAFYSSHWDEFHGLLQKLKHSLGSAKGDEIGWLNMVFIEMIHQGFRGIRQSVERSVAALRQRLAKQRLLCLMRERSFYSNTCP